MMLCFSGIRIASYSSSFAALLVLNLMADYVNTTGYCFRTGFWDSELVSTHRCTVSTPQADCVDTQADRVDTTGYCFRTCFWDSHLVLTPQVDCVDTTRNLTVAEYEAQFSRLARYANHLVSTERMKAKRFLNGLKPSYITQLAPLDIQTYAVMVKKAQLLKDATDFIEHIKGRIIKKE
ncbi:hypothetical protein Taro_014311 [Colocasia esculenta]|uniref:Retrotransposon gag domain-containing protein n=1 Tax=Colocasia esculenta TaxID=4460 RepID=A0A843UIG8_COLES|nr:hypothetical protein [Colocasia esculenta]